MLARAFLALALVTPVATAQFRAEDHPSKGLKVQRPLKYKAVPTTPTEKFILLRYAEKPDERKPKKLQPQLQIVRIDWAPDIQSSPLAPSIVSYPWSINITTAYL